MQVLNLRRLLPLGKVQHDQHGFLAEKTKPGQQLVFIFTDLDIAQGNIIAERLVKTFEQHPFAFDDGLVAADAFFLLFDQMLQFTFDGDQVIEGQFAIHGLDVAQGIDRLIHMGHIFVLENTHHVDQAVHLGQLVEQCARDAATLAGTAIQTSDVDVGHLGIDGLLGDEHLRQFIHTRVGNIHDRCVHFDLAAGRAGRLAATGERVEEGCFPRLGESDDSETHMRKSLTLTDLLDIL